MEIKIGEFLWKPGEYGFKENKTSSWMVITLKKVEIRTEQIEINLEKHGNIEDKCLQDSGEFRMKKKV